MNREIWAAIVILDLCTAWAVFAVSSLRRRVDRLEAQVRPLEAVMPRTHREVITVGPPTGRCGHLGCGLEPGHVGDHLSVIGGGGGRRCAEPGCERRAGDLGRYCAMHDAAAVEGTFVPASEPGRAGSWATAADRARWEHER